MSQQIQTEETSQQTEDLEYSGSESGPIVNDVIFGFITLKPHIVKIINTVEFQRLRSICQMGVVQFVYPTAAHNRYEHSIGTYHLASKLVTKLQKQLIEENAPIRIDKKDVKCVEIAALCHDIGHGPFSHFWDNTVLPDIFGEGNVKEHEDHVRYVLDEKFGSILSDEGLYEEHKNLIYALINGEVVEGKELLCKIVSNSESGMDVDKWDYLARDSLYLGHASTNFKIEVELMIHRARAVNDNGKWTIAFRKSEGLNMIRVFQLRHHLHQTACCHKTVVALDRMLLDGVKTHIRAHPGLKRKIAQPDWICNNNDSIFWANMETVPEFKRILERKLYKHIYTATIDRKVDDPTRSIIQFLLCKDHRHYDDDISCERRLKFIRFGFSKLKLGSTNDNPMMKIPFWEVGSPKKVFRYSATNMPLNLRYNVDESKLLIFSINADAKTMEGYDKAKVIAHLNEYFEGHTNNGVRWQTEIIN